MSELPYEGDVPRCDTGPAGRWVFVVREIRTAWRRREGKHQRSAT
jgi:hypothetical protein